MRSAPAGPAREVRDAVAAPLILVVEDEMPLRRILAQELGRQGYEVLTAHDGLDALGILDRRVPDLALLDIIMPHLDGLRLCRWLRADPRFRDVAVIFLTCRDQPSDRAQGLAAGADDYLTKPFAMNALLARIRHQLAARGKPVADPGGG